MDQTSNTSAADKTTGNPPTESPVDVEFILRDWLRNLKRREQTSNFLSAVAFLILVLMLWHWIANPPFAKRLWELLRVYGYLFLMSSMWVAGWIHNILTTKRIIKQIEGVEDTRLVGPLIEMASPFGQMRMGRKVRNASTKALIRLLPQVKPVDSCQLSDHQLYLLRTYLKGDVRDDPDFATAIIVGWEKFGGSRELGVLKELIKCGELGTPNVREAAKKCLPLLMANAEAEMKGASLLRAVETPHEAELALLKPAVSVTQAAEEQLLRPAE